MILVSLVAVFAKRPDEIETMFMAISKPSDDEEMRAQNT
jgi:hypothetical protein